MVGGVWEGRSKERVMRGGEIEGWEKERGGGEWVWGREVGGGLL